MKRQENQAPPVVVQPATQEEVVDLANCVHRWNFDRFAFDRNAPGDVAYPLDNCTRRHFRTEAGKVGS